MRPLPIIALLFSTSLLAQNMVQYDQSFQFREGIFLTFKDFKNNTAVPNSAIVTNLNPNSPDFYNELLTDKVIKLKTASDSIVDWKTNEIWGFCRNGNIYINYQNDFYRIPVLGSLSYFVAKVVVRNSFYDPWNGVPTDQYQTELRQFILDFETGDIYDFELENFLKLLQRDEQLYTEFTKLKKRKQRDQMFIYLRKYNDAHPIYFPSN